MKEYNIELSEEENIVAVDGVIVNEVGLCLQIYQDLVKINTEHREDVLIKDILEQILSKEHEGKENIPMPDYYSPEGQRVESKIDSSGNE
tara:strand:- start:921 stop:1190 length:270 start_codon:yes stop_codon:yes gene_type:complete